MLRKLNGLLAITAAVFLAPPVMAGELDFGLSGTPNFAPGTEPFPHLANAEVQQFLLDAAKSPPTVEQAADRLQGGLTQVRQLQTAHLVQLRNGRVYIDFNLFTVEDQRRIRTLAQRLSLSLARDLAADPALRSLAAARRQPGIDPATDAFILLGCVGLDWDGLAITRARGLRTAGRARPDGTYLIWARESGDGLSTRGIYWACRDVKAGSGHVATYGDSYAERRTFPDVAWSLGEPSGSAPVHLKTALTKAMRIRAEALQEPVAAILLALRQGPMSISDLASATRLAPDELDESVNVAISMRYLRKEGSNHVATVPVFAGPDREHVTQVRRGFRRVLEPWLDQNRSEIRAVLQELSAVRAGVSEEEVFTDVWHDLFGWTSYRLAQAGFILDPYGPSSSYTGYAPFIWADGLQLKADQ